MPDRRWLLLALLIGALAALAAPAGAATVTAGSDAARTGWYPDQPRLSRQQVTGGTFGQLFAQNVVGQVYAQPLVSNGVLLVATEENRVYGLDPETGAQRWSRSLGNAFQAGEIGCGDLAPSIGITSTPVIDDSGTGTAYLVVKRYRTGTSGATMFEMYALDMQTGATKPGWPVELAGTAQNDTAYTFAPRNQNQRPALLLLDGVVYAAFAGHCDISPYTGWVMGVATTGTPRSTARWVALGASGRNGAGIWQSGGGLVSDGTGRIFLGTGNGWANNTDAAPIPGTSPGDRLGESEVRLQVQGDGSLKAADFFSPYNALALDGWDADLSSGAPLALPPVFGAGTSTPNLLFQVGKQGRIYLIDRSAMGGFKNGTGGGDAVVAAIDGNEGVWARAAVWPGDGGYLWMPTASGGSSAGGSTGHLVVYRAATVAGKPTLSRVATSSDAWPYSSSGPAITSNGTASGSAIAWLVKSGGASGAGAQLVAYDAVPGSGGLVPLWSSGTFTASKFNPPGVGPSGRIYVGTRDGRVLGFGAPIAVPLDSNGAAFPVQTVGSASAPTTVTVTASAAVTITGVSSSGSEFAIGTPGQSLPASLTAGGTLTVPVTFTPSDAGNRAANLHVTTDHGSVDFPLTGTGRLASAHLSASRVLIDFGGHTPGERASGSVVFTNDGGSPLTISAVGLPDEPFEVTGAPTAGQTIAAGASVTVEVDFAPTATGSFGGDLTVDAGAAGSADVGLSGTAAPPGDLSIAPLAIDLGSVPIGSSATTTITLRNTGGSSLVVTKSKPPALGPFTALDPLDEGTVIPGGTTITLRVRFTPTALGVASDGWTITATDQNGVRTVALTGRGTVPDPSAGGWHLNGSAAVTGTTLTLNPATLRQAGTAFWPQTVATSDLTVRFDAVFGNGPAGADGLAVGFANPASGATAASLGAYGGGLGWAGIAGVAIAFDTFDNGAADPSANFVGISTSRTSAGLVYDQTATSDVPALSGSTRQVEVRSSGGVVSVRIGGVLVLQRTMSLPANALIGFSGGTGGASAEAHSVRNVVVESGAAPPPPPPPPPVPTLAVQSRVVAPAGAPELARTFAFSGTCPTAYTTASLGNGGSAAPVVTAAIGDPCVVGETAPGTGWTATATINGGASVALASAAGGRVELPPFTLASGQNTVVVTNTFVPTGTSVPAPPAGGWRLNGTSRLSGSDLVLTDAVLRQAGSAFWPTALPSANLTIDFDAVLANGPNGGDGLVFGLANPAAGASATSLGAYGGGLGWGGIAGLAVALDTYDNGDADPSANFVGVSTSRTSGGLVYDQTATANVPALSGSIRHVHVRLLAGQLTVSIDGTQVLQRTVSLPAQVLVGFAGGTGGVRPEAHSVRNVAISVG